MKKTCIMLMVLFAASGLVYAEGVQYGTVIQNQASITAGNVATAVLGNISYATVRRIGGAAYQSIGSDAFTGPLATAYIDMTLINMGNGADAFGLSIVTKQSDFSFGTGVDTPWTYSIVDGADAPITATTVLAPAATFLYRVKVVVPVTADDQDYIEFRVAATSLTNTTAITYLDDTGYRWGRSIGYDWTGAVNGTAGLLQHAFTNNTKTGSPIPNAWLRFTISGPVLSISKWVSAVTVNGVADVVKPGAIITWTIRITNNGTSSGTNIIVRDTRLGSTTFVSQSVGTYLTTKGVPVGDVYSWTGVNLPAKTADTVKFCVRVQ